MLSLGLSLTSCAIRRRSGEAWSPGQLFTPGARGVFYDAARLDGSFQDAAGVTPVTAPGQPIGRLPDRSGNGNHALQSVALSRPVLEVISGVNWISPDGVNDNLRTADLDFSHTDKVTVWAVVRRGNNDRLVAEFGRSFNDAGSWYLSTENTYSFNTGGTGYRARRDVAPATAADILIATIDRADSQVPVVRLNGIEAGALASSGVVTGNFNAARPISLFSRWSGSAVSVPSSTKLHLFGLIDRALSNSEREKLQGFCMARLA